MLGMHSWRDLMNWMSDSSSIANAPSHCMYLRKRELGMRFPFYIQFLICPQKKIQFFSGRFCVFVKMNEIKHLDIVELSDLGKEPHICLGVLVVPELDGLSPVVAPLHHGSGLQMI